jgi:hypothetical protein
LPNNPTLNNLVVVTFSTNNAPGTFSCKDSAATPNIYSLTSKTPFIDALDGIAAGIFYLVATATATKTITITFPAAAGGDAFAGEFSGNTTTGVFESDQTASQATVTTVNLPSVTMVHAGDLLIGNAGMTTAITSSNAPWTNWPSGVGANGGASEYMVQAAAGPQAVNFTCSSGNSCGIIAAFIAAAGAAAPPGAATPGGGPGFVRRARMIGV